MVNRTMGYYLAIDIGGTWIKGMISYEKDILGFENHSKIVKVRSRLTEGSDVNDFIRALEELLQATNLPLDEIDGIGISTAGVVNYHGSKLVLCAAHLEALKSDLWIQYLRSATSATTIRLINDADAAAIGAAQLGYIVGKHTYAVIPIGTGIGCTIIRNGRRWTPNGVLPLIGSIYIPGGTYDKLASASALENKEINGRLEQIFKDERYKTVRMEYLNHLSGIMKTVQVLYGVDRILLGGGLAEAAFKCGFEHILYKELTNMDPDLHLHILCEGNNLPLYGALYLAIGEAYTSKMIQKIDYSGLKTEESYDASLSLNRLDTFSILNLLNKVEIEASTNMCNAVTSLEKVIEAILPRLNNGGRLIYVGCGTSGRLAAVDAVELTCTFGFPKERVLTFISGGLVDALFEIESNFEEDASSIPDLLMANISNKDSVVGISVSGTANYVLSALAFSKMKGAFTVMVQENAIATRNYVDYHVALNTGAEVIAGSTRMKAGTATKKILNYLSTSLMVRLGRVHGTFMTEMECVNEKLIKRAVKILKDLYGISDDYSLHLLEKYNWNLNDVIKMLEESHGYSDVQLCNIEA